MLYRFALGVVRRAVTLPFATRPVLVARPISTTPLVRFAEASAPVTTTKTRTKTTTKSKSKPGPKPKTKTKAKPKPKAVKKKKVKKEKKKVTFTRSELKVHTRPSKTPFLLFCTEERAKLPKSDSLVAAQLVVKDLAQKWHNLTPEQKQVYHDKSTKQHEEMSREYKQWLDGLDSNVLREINRRRKLAGKPKIRRQAGGARPSFFIFLEKFKMENPGLSVIEASTKAGAAWRALTEDQKAVYRAASQEEKDALVGQSSA